MENNDVVFIGNKPVMNYALAMVTQSNGGANNVIIKARYRAISRDVDLNRYTPQLCCGELHFAEVVRNNFLDGVKLKDNLIYTEKVTSDCGESNVSAMEITIGK